MTDAPPGVDLERLRPWFAAHVDGATGGELTASLISGGRSNLTYGIRDGANQWVLRRPPLGHVLPTAHDMAREYKVLSALAPTGVPVPATLGFCDDVAVNDAPFYAMELIDGNILRTGADIAKLSHDDARRCSEELIDVLVAIHAVDYEAVGLGDFGHPDGYVELRDRAKDVVISGGENISTVEVEQALMSHPAVLEVAVIGVPDEKWGERPKAFVVLKEGYHVEEGELIDHVRIKIARYKAPRNVDFLVELPKTSTGKIQKFALREREWAGKAHRVQG